MLADMPDMLLPLIVVGLPVGLFVFIWLVATMESRQKILRETNVWNFGRCSVCNQSWKLIDISEDGKTYNCPCENNPIIITTNVDMQN